MPRRLIHRHQASIGLPCRLKAGFGGLLGIGFMGWLGHVGDLPLLVAPFGASAVLLFGVPGSPLSQPANVIGGHLMAAAASLALKAVLPEAWWSVGLAVGLVTFLMVAFRVIHPPAGAVPVVVFLSDPGLDFLYLTIPVGAVTLVAIAVLVHRIPPKTTYPLPVPEADPEDSG